MDLDKLHNPMDFGLLDFTSTARDWSAPQIRFRQDSGANDRYHQRIIGHAPHAPTSCHGLSLEDAEESEDRAGLHILYQWHVSYIKAGIYTRH